MSQPIDMMISPRVKDLGDGFQVRRVLPFHARRMVGPFIFFDHFGPVTHRPGQGMDVRPHPHIGLATVTYLFEGAIAHKDTVGSDIVIRPGAVNWMTAGRGIVHSERTPPEERASGQTLHGIQTWVALPQADEETEPGFEHHPADTLPVLELGGVEVRLLAGSGWGARSPVSFPHDIWYAAADATESGHFEVPGEVAQERAIYAVAGEAEIAGTALKAGCMAVLGEGADVDVRLTSGTKLMLCGGAPMDGKRLIDWNFVASNPERIARARADWRASIAGGWQGTIFGLPDGEDEHIPLPEDQ